MENNKLSDCIINKNVNYIPIWFMRQAGRYLPEFREIRKENKDFLKLCFNPKLSTEISLQPLHRFDLDAAIIFSDILTVPYGLNQNVNFVKGQGPILQDLDIEKTLETTVGNFSEKLKPSYEAIKLLREKLPKNKALIGFLGAPWTLLVYMFHKKSPKTEINLENFFKDKITIEKVLEKLIEVLVVDGMSKDNTRSMVKKFSKKYSYIKLIDNQKRVIPAAMIIGIRRGKGDLIMKMDS